MSVSSLPVAPMEFWYGEKTLLTWPTASVFSSRQGKYPVGSEEWVKATLEACADVARKDHVLLTSVGMHTWELAAWAAGETLGQVVLLVPLEEGLSVARAHPILQQYISDFGLTQSTVLVVPWFVKRGQSVKESWKQRDRWLLERAKRLLPISIRPGGSLETLIGEPEFEGKVERTWAVNHSPATKKWPTPPDPEAVEAKLGGDWPWLVHWTRSTPDPWPGEATHEFYSALVQSGRDYPRDAFATLTRIVTERRLRGTRWRMPMAQPLVSFTSLPPWEMVHRMTWRKRYARPAFEPYGVAVHRDALSQFGGRSVRYGAAEERVSLSALDRLFFQVQSDVGADWQGEQEWRIRGDLELPPQGSDQVKLLVPSESEAERLRTVSPFEVVSLL
ncbi:hypothetical protein KQI63_03845 [bacterium]|nr:hypothetical protein [bacterium]